MERAKGTRPTALLIAIVIIPAFNCDIGLQTESCSSSVATTELVGSILIQSASVRERFGVEMNNETIPSLRQPKRRVGDSIASSTVDSERFATFKVPFNLSRVFTHELSLLQHVIGANTSWTGIQVNSLRIGRDSAVPYVLALLLFFVIVGVAWWLAFDHSMNTTSTHAEFSSRSDAPQSLTSDMIARSKFDSRAYASSSPSVPGERRQQVPLERARSSPQASTSPTPLVSVPRGRTLHTSDDCRRLSGSMPAAPSNLGDPAAFNPRESSVGPQFCPELIVPQHCECILLVPLNSDRYSSFEVTDCNGSCVLRVVPQAPTAGRLWRATITSATGELLGQCCEASYQASSRYAPEFHLLQAGGQLWAKLLHNPNQERYVLNFMNGGVMNLWGNFDEHAVNITNETNQLLATTEVGSADFDPNGKYYCLRVAPTADVGLAICSLLCIGQHMTNQRKANASI